MGCCVADVWKADTNGVWSLAGNVGTYSFFYEPAGAVFAGNDSNLFVKVYLRWTSGWVSGSPPQPLFVADRSNPTSFVGVAGGDNIDGLAAVDGCVYANTPSGIAEAVDGVTWRGVLTSNGRILDVTRRSQFFLFEHFTGITLVNKFTGGIPFKNPTWFDEIIHPLLGVAYNGRHLVVAGASTTYVSTNFGPPWAVTDIGAGLCGLAYDGKRYLLAAVTETNTAIYALESEAVTAPSQTLQGVDARIGQETWTNVLGPRDVRVLSLGVQAASGSLYQVECSHDFETWLPHGLPTTNLPAPVDLDSASSSSLIFRIQSYSVP